ncbi:sulfite oxidase-like oxidoreductase [Ferroacidibacillus organovorans]|uniref:Oxidoreductase n=1 Tax=Ferroacidibacillus organovorans TaxID=1765683 RepID=A0A853K8E4_9BACL|nr:sulfite oxidase-like oxidoreductase [Ferroacidibacillus organovorans]KYP81131.1 oxidoreductase [Ferroacidibacillus organovorans]OAG93097.1 oxidoreductase [Ferroacidibacillus organovorans]
MDSQDLRGKRRLPEGQYLTTKWPVLHAGTVPRFDAKTWDLHLFGEIEQECRFRFEEVMELPRVTYRCDIHCVTTWSRYDNVWEGVSLAAILERVKPNQRARFVTAHCEQGFTTNLPLEELMKPGVMLALKHDGAPLTPEHGYPLRLMVPHLYFWKSAKWVRGLEFTENDRAGFWEERGYHMLGDPWVTDEQNPDGQRFRDDPLWFGSDDPAAYEQWRKEIEQKRREVLSL